MRSMEWSDFTTNQRRGLTIAAIVQLVLLGTALNDLRRRTSHELRGGKRLWSVAVFVNLVGPVAYFLIGKRRWLERGAPMPRPHNASSA